MIHAIQTLNYSAVVVTAITGFMIGWLWYSPMLFAKAWMAEMKFTEESMKEAAKQGMAKTMLTAFAFTVLMVFTLAVLLRAHGSAGGLAGAKLGGFVAAGLLAATMGINYQFEQRSWKLWAINAGHEFAVCVVAGAILATWR